ncbi:MAG: CbiX/SirB N-terminal domain-containing protein, partial [Planctomycetota bacterium]
GDRVSALIQRLVHNLAERKLFDEVVATFHKQPPFFGDLLGTLAADEIIVVPILTSAGYTYRTIMPRESKLSGTLTRRDGRIIRVARPVGELPQITDLIERIARQAMGQRAWTPKETALVIAGHGSELDADSSQTTLRHAETLRSRSIFGEVVGVFLNESPPVDAVFDLTTSRHLVVIPNLLGGSIHVTRDIPRLLSVPVEGDTYPPRPAEVRGRTIVLTPTPFEEPSIVELILALADEARDSQEER